MVNGFFNRLIHGAHGNDDGLCIFCTIIVEELIIRSDLGIHLVHVLLDHVRNGIVGFVAGLSGLEKDIRILCGTHLARMAGIQTVVLKVADCLMIDHLVQVFVIPNLNLLNFMGGTEAVKEVDKRNSSLNGSAVCNRRQIHHFLNGRGTEQSGTGLTTCVYIGMIAENIQCMRRHAAGGNIEDTRKTLTGTFVNVRNHQQKSLRSGIGGS